MANVLRKDRYRQASSIGMEAKRFHVSKHRPSILVTDTRLHVKPQEREGGYISELFISSRGPPKPATRTVIGNWIRSVLLEAGVQEPPGSVR
jgi:hypothetical protein